MKTLSRKSITIDLKSLATSAKIDDTLERAASADVVIVDMRALKRMTAAVLEAVVRIKKTMLSNGRRGSVRLVFSSPAIHRTLSITGLGKIFEVHETLASAAGRAHLAPVPEHRSAA